MTKQPYHFWYLPEIYEADYGLFYFPVRTPPTFSLKPPLSTHLEEKIPAYGACWAEYRGTKLAPIMHLEVRRTGKKRFSICVVKSPGGVILRKLDNKKTRSEAEQVLSDFMKGN